MSNLANTIVSSAVSFLLLLAIGCSKPPSPAASTAPEITIGLIAPLSGEIADLGRDILNSAQLAARHVNDEGDIRVKLEVRDDQSNAATASTAARSLTSVAKVSAVIAAGITPVVLAEIEALADASIPLVTPTATATALAGGRPFVFRVIPSNAAQGVALAKLARQGDGRTAALLVQQEAYSTDLADAFDEAFTRDGGRVALKVPFDPTETDFRAQLNQIKRANPDVVLFAAQHVPVARMLVRARELGLRSMILAGETAYTDKLLNAAGHAAEGLYVTGAPFDLTKPKGPLKQFVDAYRAQNPDVTPSLYGSYTYDAVRLIASAAASAARGNEPNLVDQLRKTRFAGVTGDISFDSSGNVTRDYEIYVIKDGQFRIPAGQKTR